MRLQINERRAPLSSGVSVVVPCYKLGHFVQECVESILLDNSDVATEIILIDDASPDDSGAVCRRLAQADSRIRLLEHDWNRGHIATYNEGLALATKKYSLLLSADDLVAPGSLRRAVVAFERNPSVGLVYGPVEGFRGRRPRPSEPPPFVTQTIWHGRDWISSVYERGINPIQSPEALVRTSIQRQVGEYDASHPHAGDLHMWLRVAAVADVARINMATQAFRRRHEAAMSVTQFSQAIADLDARCRVFEQLLPKLHLSSSAETIADEGYRRALSREAIIFAGIWGGEEGPHGPAATEMECWAKRLAPRDSSCWHRKWLESVRGQSLSRIDYLLMRTKKAVFFRADGRLPHPVYGRIRHDWGMG